MATEAQIRANRANARKSKGPTTDEGKARARLNALKHGMRAEVAAPLAAPQEDPAELTARIQAWLDDYQPTGTVERDLVERAARLSWDLDRAQRHEAALTARRVREAMLNFQAERAAVVAGLARKLLYMCGKRNVPGSGPPWDDEPRVFALALQESAEGTRWMIERWTEIRRLIDSGAAWSFPDQYKFIRLLGKHPVDAVDDPELNAIVLAWEAITEKWGVVFWGKTRDETPSDNPAFNAWRAWRALVPPPENAEAGWLLLRSIVDRELKRLTERLAILEEVEGDDAQELAERALLATDAGAERLRRHQSARTRELLRTLDAIAKLRKLKAREAEISKKAPIEANDQEKPSPIILLPPGAGGTPLVGSGRGPDEGRRVYGESAGTGPGGRGSRRAPRIAPARREPRPPGKPLVRMKITKKAPNEANPPAAEPSEPSSVAGLCEAETGVRSPRPASRGHRPRLQKTGAGRRLRRSSVAGLCEAGTGVGSPRLASRGHRPRLQQSAGTGSGPMASPRGHGPRLRKTTCEPAPASVGRKPAIPIRACRSGGRVIALGRRPRRAGGNAPFQGSWKAIH